MKLSKYLLESVYTGIYKLPSQVDIICERADSKLIMDRLLEIFQSEHKDLLMTFTYRYGNCTNANHFPMKRYMDVTEEGIAVKFEGLCLYYDNGDGEEVKGEITSIDAVRKSFEKLKKEFPDIEYSGFIAEIWADDTGGGVMQWEVTSDDGKDGHKRYVIYESLGRLIGKATESNGFWKRLSECSQMMNPGEMEEVIYQMTLYYEYVPRHLWTELKGILLHYDFANETRYLFQFITVISLISNHRFRGGESLHVALTSGYIELILLVSYIARNTKYKSKDIDAEFGQDSFEEYYEYACKLVNEGDEYVAKLVDEYVKNNS